MGKADSKPRGAAAEAGAALIHPTAIVHPRAQIGAGCQIGPYCVIGADVVLGEGCRLHPHVVIEGRTILGRENEVFPFASLGLQTQDLKWRGGNTRTEIGDHNTFREYVTVNSATGDGEVTRVGSHNHFLVGCHLAHNVAVGNHVVISNLGTLGGHVLVEDGAVIGGLAAVHQFCRIGTLAFIGGCSKVVQDVPPYMLADGNPAATRTINKVGLERKGVPETTQAALKQAYKLLFRDGLAMSNALERIASELPPLPELVYLAGFIRRSARGISKRSQRET